MAGLGVGEPLSGATRDLLRPRLGVDVSGVRIHTGPAADCNARALGAQAFTFGQDVVFAEGRYDPSTRAGLELLTHELVHVGQQSSQRPARSVQRDGKPREGTVTVGKITYVEGKPPPESDINLDWRFHGLPKGNDVWVTREGYVTSEGVVTKEYLRQEGFKRIGTGTIGPPLVRPVGCSPGGKPGNVGFFAGSPAWQMNGNYTFCGPADRSIQVGFVQTVQGAANGSVDRDATTGALSKGYTECVVNARDCVAGANPPWYGTRGSPPGPHAFGGTFPVLSDTPNLVRVSRAGQKRLQDLRYQGIFHVWLIARRSSGTTVFVHHWSIALAAAAVLSPGADPCNVSGWQILGGAAATAKGPGPGLGEAGTHREVCKHIGEAVYPLTSPR